MHATTAVVVNDEPSADDLLAVQRVAAKKSREAVAAAIEEQVRRHREFLHKQHQRDHPH